MMVGYPAYIFISLQDWMLLGCICRKQRIRARRTFSELVAERQYFGDSRFSADGFVAMAGTHDVMYSNAGL